MAKNTKTIPCTKELTFELTDKERKVKLETSLKLEAEIDGLKLEVKTFRDNKNVTIKSLAKEREVLRKHIDDNQEPRTVNCNEVFLYDQGIVEYVYKGQLYDTRKMMDHERQEALPLKAPKKARKKRDDDVKEVIRSETNSKTKMDMSTTPEATA